MIFCPSSARLPSRQGEDEEVLLSVLPSAPLLARPSALPKAPLLDAPLAVQYAAPVRPDLRQKRQRRALPSALSWAALAAVRPAVAEGPCLGSCFPAVALHVPW